MKWQGVRAVVFDLDDTLCAYWDACKSALHETFTRFPVEDQTPKRMMQHWAASFQVFGRDLKAGGWYDTYLKTGEPTRTEQMRLTLERVGIEDLALAKQLSATYAELRNQDLRLFDDALEVLDDLKAKYPLGMITNGPADIQRQEVNTLKLAPYFQSILIEGEQGLGKPHEEVFRRSEKELGASAEGMVMVGNSYNHDIKASMAAGWRAIWIRRPSDVPPSAGEDGKPEEKPAGDPDPHAIIHGLSELKTLL